MSSGVDRDKYKKKKISLPNLANETVMLEQYYRNYRRTTMDTNSP